MDKGLIGAATLARGLASKMVASAPVSSVCSAWPSVCATLVSWAEARFFFSLYLFKATNKNGFKIIEIIAAAKMASFCSGSKILYAKPNEAIMNENSPICANETAMVKAVVFG